MLVSSYRRPPGALHMTTMTPRGQTSYQASRRRPTRPTINTVKPRLERLEDRLALSGFGPEDGAYIVESWAGTYSSVTIRPSDQAIVAAGAKDLNENTQMAVARYDAQGNNDSAFGSGGVASVGPTGTEAYSVLLQPDGKAVLAGYIAGSSSNDIGIARVNDNGSPDSSFSGDGWASVSTASGSQYEAVSGVGLQSNGDIIVGGLSKLSGAQSAVVASFKANGTLDSGKGGFGQSVQGKPAGYLLDTFGAYPMVSFSQVAVQPDNKVVAVGMRTTDASTYKAGAIVARYTADGKLDTSFNGGGLTTFAPSPQISSQALAVALQLDGKIVIAGVASGVDGSSDFLVARYTASGTLDATFGSGSGYVRLDIDGLATQTNEQAFDVGIQADGKIVVAGREFVQADTSRSNIVVSRLNADGTPDNGFGSAGFKLACPPAGQSFDAQGVALQSDGSIIVTGADSDLVNRKSYPLLMRFSGASNAPAAAASSTTTSSAAATDVALMFLLTEDLTLTTQRK
jgi:uncharacterized delta-60 repeat protein